LTESVIIFDETNLIFIAQLSDKTKIFVLAPTASDRRKFWKENKLECLKHAKSGFAQKDVVFVQQPSIVSEAKSGRKKTEAEAASKPTIINVEADIKAILGNRSKLFPQNIY